MILRKEIENWYCAYYT